MKEQWLKEIQKRMADYETEEPAGLWESVQAHLHQPEKAHKRLLWLWTKRIGTAAAVIAIIASAGLLATMENKKENLPVATADTPIREQDVVPETMEQDNERQQLAAVFPENQTSQENVEKGKKRSPYMEMVTKAGQIDTPSETTTETDCSSEPQQQESATQAEPTEPDKPTKPKQPYPLEPELNLPPRRSQHISNRLSVSLFASGGSHSSLHDRSAGEQIAGMESNPSEWKDNPMLAILLFSRGQDMEIHIDHKQPIREGVSFSYKLNKRVSLESGLSYTILSSDLKQGSKNHYFTGKQTLHYIGLPLNVKYSIISWKQLDLYASAGALIEQRIKGKVEKKYFIDNKAEKTERENIASKPLQLSANIGAGLQYNLSPTIGIYAEPGLSYYVDDNSSIQTIYKEKPLNFNLNLGIRFSFKK